jgi:cbb3-type cytochrome oxidase subunit 3
MKFIHYIEKVGSVDVIGLAGLLIFVIFFTGVLLWAWKADKKVIDQINHIPLDN